MAPPRQDYPPAGLGLRPEQFRNNVVTVDGQDYPPAGLTPDPDRFVPYKLVRRIPWVPTI